MDAPPQGGISNGVTHGINPLPSETAPLESEQHANTVAAPTEQAGDALFGKEGSMNKPSSPTSVLPNQGGLGVGDTTYHSSHGLADAYPELYKAAAAAGRAEKANSRALQCFVGDTLRGNPDLWRHQLKSAYTLCNDRLKRDAVGNPGPLLCPVPLCPALCPALCSALCFALCSAVRPLLCPVPFALPFACPVPLALAFALCLLLCLTTPTSADLACVALL